MKAWNGRRWAVQRGRTPAGAKSSTLAGVSCSSARPCSAVGTAFGRLRGSQTLAERRRGATWHIQSTPGNPAGAVESSLAAASCTSVSACTAIGSGLGPMAARWDGRTWSIEKTPIPAAAVQGVLAGVSCPSALACTAVGGQGGTHVGDTVPLAEHWDGLKWAIQPSPTPRGAHDGSLQGVSCTSVQACIAVGSYFNGNVYQVLVERHS